MHCSLTERNPAAVIAPFLARLLSMRCFVAAEGRGLGQARRRRRRRRDIKRRQPVLGGGVLRGVRQRPLGCGGAAGWLGGPAPQGGRVLHLQVTC